MNLKYESEPKTDEEFEAVDETRKTSRRGFLKLLGMSTAAATGLAAIGEGLKHTDTEIGKALRFLDTYENIKYQQEKIEQAQQEFNADTVAVLRAPEAYAEKLKKIREEIEELTKEVEKINQDGIRVNSGFVYQQQKKIQAVLARFNNENFRTIFVALGIYQGITGKAREVFDIVGSKVRNLVGGALGGYAGQFINQKTAEAKRMVSGNITVFGVEIPIASLAQFALEAQKLSSSLIKLQAELEKLSDPNVDISNNDWIDCFSTENPRKDFLKGYSDIGDIMKKNNEEGGDFDPDEVKKIQEFLVKYGYIIKLGNEDPVNGEYDKKTSDALLKLINILENAPKFREKFRQHLARGVENPVIARGKDVRDLQDLLGLSGYMSLKQVDGAYGRTTYDASVKCTEDWREYFKEK